MLGTYLSMHRKISPVICSLYGQWDILWKTYPCSAVYKRYIYGTVWDPDIILGYLSNLEYDLSLKELSERLVILLCLLSGKRDQTVKALNIKDMLLEKCKCTFFIKRSMKTTKPGSH